MSDCDDRDYHYLLATLHAPELTVAQFVERVAAHITPAWRELVQTDHLRSVRWFAATGEIDLHTDPAAVRPWDYVTLAEIEPGTNPSVVGQRADRALHISQQVQVLSSELIVRRAASGTAIPKPSTRLPRLPDNHSVGIEYIHIPDGRHDEYRQFMHDIFGPVGRLLVERGQAYQVIISERAELYRWDDSLPAWNRIHILISDFDHEPGFFDATNTAVREVLGTGVDVHAALAPANSYRSKPRMSKNVVLHSLSIS
jgi:hypothetical protein